MKVNSRILGIFAVLLVVAVVVSAVSATTLDNENFSIDITSGSDFAEEATTSINAGDVVMKMFAFENVGNNSDDISTIMYMKDSSADKKVISDFISDLKSDGDVVEESGKYVVLKTKASDDINLEGIGDVLNVANDLLSSAGDLNFSADENQISLSDKGLEVSDASGEHVSISSKGIEVSGSGDGSDGNVTFDGNMTANIQGGDYVVYLEDGNQVLTLSGNNVDVLKKMADSVTFKGK